MRLLICGDRDWVDSNLIRSVIELLNPAVVIEGEADGADILAREEAKKLSIPFLAFPAHWRHFTDCVPECKRIVGRPAGPIRNQQMLTEGKPTTIVGFHDAIHNSKGTKDMLNRGLKAGIRTYLIFHDDRSTSMVLFPITEKII